MTSRTAHARVRHILSLLRRSTALLLLASLCLPACGKGGSRAVPPLPATTGAPAPSGTVAVSGTLAIPSGVNLNVGTLTVMNQLGARPVKADGSFASANFTSDAQLTLVLDAGGNPVLGGFISPQSPKIDSASTAKMFIYFAAGFYQLQSPFRGQAIDAVATQPGFAAVQGAIEAALRANPAIFATGDGGVTAAVNAFVTALYAKPAGTLAHLLRPAGARTSRSIAISPSNASGITVLQDFPNGIHFQNQFRRLARAYIDEDSYVDQNGTRIPKNVADVVPSQEIPAVRGLSEVTGSLVTAVQNIYTGQTQYTPVSTATIPLAVEPGSRSTRYDVTIVGGGALAGVAVTEERDKERTFLCLQQLVQDFIVPIVAAWIIPANHHAIDDAMAYDGAAAIASDLVAQLLVEDPEIATLARDGHTEEAVSLALDTIAKSSSLQALILQKFLDSIKGELGFAAGAEFFTKMSGVVKALHLLSATLVAADMAIMIGEYRQSSLADRFTVDVLADGVTISPQSATIESGASQSFTAAVPAASGSGETIVWHWSTTTTAGHLTDGIAGHVDSFDSSNNVVTYTGSAGQTSQDTITVTAFLVQGNQRTQIGSPAHATITVSPKVTATVSIAPGRSNLAHNGGESLSASVPPGSQNAITYRWTLIPNALGGCQNADFIANGSCGHLTDPASGAKDTFTTASPTVNYAAAAKDYFVDVMVEEFDSSSGAPRSLGTATASIAVGCDSFGDLTGPGNGQPHVCLP